APPSPVLGCNPLETLDDPTAIDNPARQRREHGTAPPAKWLFAGCRPIECLFRGRSADRGRRRIGTMGDDRPAPESYEDLRTAIALRFGQLSDRLQRIARHALAHPDAVALDTVAATAKRAAVQPSSLIRFARAFGYDGFSDMQQVFRRHLVTRSPDYGERPRTVGPRVDPPEAAPPHRQLLGFIDAAM